MLQDAAQVTGIKEDWVTALDEQGVEYLVLDPQSDREMVKRFRTRPGWKVGFEDKEAVLFVRAV